jgi:hypothetical protein
MGFKRNAGRRILSTFVTVVGYVSLNGIYSVRCKDWFFSSEQANEIANFVKKTPWSESASELYRPSDRRLSSKLVPTFADRGCHEVSETDHYNRILSFLDRSRYFSYQVAPQLYSRGWMDPVSDPLLLRKSGSAMNRTQASGSVVKNSDH